ncbi:MAG: DUF512 domain-containing protein [Syntrophomonadaceae bacterium]
MAGRISGVRDGSIAAELGIVSGDRLISINGEPIDDILDYQFHAQDDNLVVEIEKPDGANWLLEIEKDYDETLGLDFEELVFDRLKPCRNRCIFCFVDQLPEHMRESLHIKDDDYRHSFINGNFITLTNLREKDWNKIIDLHLSPLYVSVHCTQKKLREKMLQNRRAGNIKRDLERLRDAGIQVHTQVVVCPGWNDGEILQETIEDLASLYPGVLSAGIVPVGLTGHRSGLPRLQPVSAPLAAAIIAATDANQARCRQALGTGFVYAADEFYIKAGRDIPPADYYDDFCQTENGIGLARIFLDDFDELEPELPDQLPSTEVFLISGQSGGAILTPVIKRLNKIKGMDVQLIEVNNKFFGGGVSVAGLLTGRDIRAALGGAYPGKKVIIPDIVLRDGLGLLLDDMGIDEISSSSGANIEVAESSAAGLVKALLGTANDNGEQRR